MLGLSLAQKGRRLEALEHLRKAQELRLGEPGGRLQIQFLPAIPLQRGLRPCPAQTSPGEPSLEAPVDLCDVGLEISRMTPCTSAEDCPAHELWSSALGLPGLRSARPELAPETPADDR